MLKGLKYPMHALNIILLLFTKQTFDKTHLFVYF